MYIKYDVKYVSLYSTCKSLNSPSFPQFMTFCFGRCLNFNTILPDSCKLIKMCKGILSIKCSKEEEESGFK